MASEDAPKQIEFKGFYLSNAIDTLAGKRRAGYFLITFLVSVIPAIVFYFLGLEPFVYVSILVYTALFIFLNLARWASNFVIKLRKTVVEKASPEKRGQLSVLIDKRLGAIVSPRGHLLSGVLVLIVVFLGVLLLNHLEWFLIPSILILSFFTGMTFWIVFQVFYFWHFFAKEVIGKYCPITPLDKDRMGGFKFIAEHLVAFSVMEIILAGFAISILLTFSWEVQITITIPLSWAIIAIVLGIVIGGYLFIVFKLHQALDKARENEISRFPLIPDNVKEELTSLTDHAKDVNVHEQIHTIISPHAYSIMAVKFVVDEIRLMRGWPINLPMVLKLIGSTIVSICLVYLQLILQFTFAMFIP